MAITTELPFTMYNPNGDQLFRKIALMNPPGTSSTNNRFEFAAKSSLDFGPLQLVTDSIYG